MTDPEFPLPDDLEELNQVMRDLARNRVVEMRGGSGYIAIEDQEQFYDEVEKFYHENYHEEHHHEAEKNAAALKEMHEGIDALAEKIHEEHPYPEVQPKFDEYDQVLKRHELDEESLSQ
jgi:hypothetical protein